MRSKLAVLCSALALAGAVAAGTPAVAGAPSGAPVTGPDESVGISAEVVPGYGRLDVSWTAAGTADTTGPTQITLDLPSWMSAEDVMEFDDPQDYTFTTAISPDGHHLTAVFTGTRKPGRTEFMEVHVTSANPVPPSVITATVSNRDDRNPADNVATVGIGGQTPPPVIPAAPRVSGLDTYLGAGTGGTAVTVSGTSLANSMVLFGDTPATGVSCTDTSCTATAPGGWGGVPVTVVTPGGTAYAPGAFLYTGPPPPAPPAPVMTQVYTNSGPSAGGNSVVLGGTNLTGGQVFFGQRPAEDVSCGPAFCTATAPAGTGTVDVRVLTPGGVTGVVSGDRYTYTG